MEIRPMLDPANGNFTARPRPKDEIWGQFIENVPTQLTVFDTGNCKLSDGCQIVDYDPDSILKIVQLVECASSNSSTNQLTHRGTKQ